MSDRVTNPFEAPDEQYLVLVNLENQHSLWPAFAEVPPGWNTRFGPEKRALCLEFVGDNWTDITPKSQLREESD